MVMQESRRCQCTASVERDPATVVCRPQFAKNQQNDVNYPPDANTSQCQQLANGRASVSETESIHAQKAKQDGIDESVDKIVTSVNDAGKCADTQEPPIAVALDALQHLAHDTSSVNISVLLTTKLSTAVAKFIPGRGIALQVQWLVTFQEFLRYI